MGLKTINKRFICSGDIITTPLDSIFNKSLKTATDIQITIKVPEGVTFLKASTPQGIFDPATNIWDVGTILAGTTLTAEFFWTVTDDCQVPLKFSFNASSDVVCLDAEDDPYCITIDGLTCCDIDDCAFDPIKTINTDYTIDLLDDTILVDSSAELITLTLPKPSQAHRDFPLSPRRTGGKEYWIKVIDLTNAVTLETPEGKLVNFSTIAAAGSSFAFSLVGQTVLVHSDGTNWYIKTV